jgi:hypothetical protein
LSFVNQSCGLFNAPIRKIIIMNQPSFDSDNDSSRENTSQMPCSFLPPGSESLDLPIAGILRLKIKNLIEMKTSANFENIKVKPIFWGEKESKFLLRAANTCLCEKNSLSNKANYYIRCSPTQFQRYLKDMKSLKLFLVDKRNLKCLGVGTFDFSPFLLKVSNRFDLKPFEFFRTEVVVKKAPNAIENKHNQSEIGHLEIEIDCEFGGNYEKYISNKALFEHKTPEDVLHNQHLQTTPVMDNKEHFFEPNCHKGKSDLSQLIFQTEQMIEEMSLEEIKNDKNLKNELKVKELKNEIACKNEEISKQKKLPIEIEIELLKMQKELLKNSQSKSATIQSRNSKIDKLFEVKSPQVKSLRISIEKLNVEVQQYQKSLSENIAFIRLARMAFDGQILETHKFDK